MFKVTFNNTTATHTADEFAAFQADVDRLTAMHNRHREMYAADGKLTDELNAEFDALVAALAYTVEEVEDYPQLWDDPDYVDFHTMGVFA